MRTYKIIMCTLHAATATDFTGLKGAQEGTQEGTCDRRYLANVLSKEVKGLQSPVVLDIFLSIIWNTSEHHVVSYRL